MMLNGWQRLWVVAVVLWGIFLIAVMAASGWETRLLPTLAAAWLAVAVFAHALGWSVGWIRRGFKKSSAAR